MLVIVAGLADYATGPDLGFSFMYLPAVSMAAWLLGLSASLGVAVAAAAVQMADALWRVQRGFDLALGWHDALGGLCAGCLRD